MSVKASGRVTSIEGHFEVEEAGRKICDIQINFRSSSGGSSYEVFDPNGNSIHSGRISMPNASNRSYVCAVDEILEKHSYPTTNEMMINDSRVKP